MPKRAHGSQRQGPQTVIFVPVEVWRTIYVLNTNRNRDIVYFDHSRITAATRELLNHLFSLFGNFLIALILLMCTVACSLLIDEYFDISDPSFDKAAKNSEYAGASYIWMLIDYTADSIYYLCDNFSEISFQVIRAVYISAIHIGAFLLGTVQFLTLLEVHFPGGIVGVAAAVLVIVLITTLGRQLLKFSEQYTKCLEAKQELQSKLEENALKLQEERQNLLSKLEEVELRLHEESEKLKLETQNSQKLKQETDQRLCGICQDRDKTILLLPCQHVCLCKECLNRKQWEKCPICRQDVKSTMEIYV